MAKKSPSHANLLADLRSFQSKDYRDGFLETDVKGGIALQIQALREKTGLSQEAFAKKIGKKQSVVSRLENTEYGGVNVNTLLEIAKALDIGLQVRFCTYADIVKRDTSPAALKVDTIFETINHIEIGHYLIEDKTTRQAVRSSPQHRIDLAPQKSPARRRGAGL